MKVVANNRQASFNYFLLDTFETGIVLIGPEVKSIRAGNISLAESFIKLSNGEVFLKNAHIAQYEQDTQNTYNPKADRKLLLNKNQIKKLTEAISVKGLTIIPTKVYLNDKGLVKLEIAIAKGKHTYDKKQTLKEKDIMREAQKQVRN